MKTQKFSSGVLSDGDYLVDFEPPASEGGKFNLSNDCRVCKKLVLPQVFFAFGVCGCGSPQLSCRMGGDLNYDQLAVALMGYVDYLMKNKVSRRMRG